MTLYRFYCPKITGSAVEITGPEAHHLASVRRLGKGDKIELFDGKGTLALAVIENLSNKKVTVRIENISKTQKPTSGRIIIAASIAKGERFDWLIAKCTELGVDRICPIIFERTVKQPKNPKITDRWQNLAIAAAKQSRRLFLPDIDSPAPLPKILENLKKDYPNAQLLVGSLAENATPLIEKNIDEKDTIAVVGPEGGITEDEQNLLESKSAHPVLLTDTILRVETAALTFAAILCTQRNTRRSGE